MARKKVKKEEPVKPKPSKQITAIGFVQSKGLKNLDFWVKRKYPIETKTFQEWENEFNNLGLV